MCWVCLYLDKRYCLFSITELCRKLCNREPVTHLEVTKTGAMDSLPFNFSVITFLLKLPKTSKFGRHTLQLWQMIPQKFFTLPKITKQLTFQTTLQDSIFQYWLAASQPPLPMRTIQSLFLAKKIPFTYSKLYVLCHKSLEDISPRIGYHITTRKDSD